MLICFFYRLDGDKTSFAHINSFISYLDLPIRWKQRIVRHFFRRTYFDSLLNRLGQGVGYDTLKKDEIIMKDK